MIRKILFLSAGFLLVLAVLWESEHLYAAAPGPTITILTPADGKTIWSTGNSTIPVRIVFRAWDADGVNSGSFKLSIDGGAFNAISAGSYGTSGVYYYDWTNPAAGNRTLQIEGSDSAGTPTTGRSRKVGVTVRVSALNNFSTLPGDGKLLVRDNDNTMCMACHAIKSHSSADIGSTKYGNWERICRDCHTPHNTRNIFLLQSSFKIYTGTNQNYAYRKKVDFRNLSGGSNYGHATQAGNNRRGPCEVCHTRTSNPDGSPRWRNYTSANDTEGVIFIKGSKHNTGKNCTSCHLHTNGFAWKESEGNQACDGCHNGLFEVMNTGNNLYHHYMNTAEVTVQPDSGSKYTVTTSILGTIGGNTKRRCLMCHADHNTFRPDLNPAYSKGRAGNLRKSIMVFPTQTSNFTNREFVNETSTSKKIWGGLCLSCHRKSQRKFTSMLANDGSVATPVIPFPGGAPSDYAGTAHGAYTVPSTFKTDGSKFNANCLKCHNDALTKTKQRGNGRNEFGTHTSSFGLHGSPVRRMQALMGRDIDVGISTGFDSLSSLKDTTKNWPVNNWQGSTVAITAGKGAGQGRVILSNSSNRLRVDQNWSPAPDNTSKYNIEDPIEEDLCFRCHSNSNTSLNPNGPAGKDYYGIAHYENERAQKMYETFNAGWPAVGKGTIGSGTTSSVIYNSGNPGWTTNQWAGYMVLIKSGRANGLNAIISSNTANTLTLQRSLRRTPVAGDRYVIRDKPYRHQVDAYTGKHRTDEYFLAENGPTRNPVGWFGADQHTGCTDCHNPHAAKPQGLTSGRATNDAFTTASTITDGGTLNGTKNWTPNQWRGYVIRIYDSGFNNLYTSVLGQSRMIVSNTANKLVLGGTFMAANRVTPRAPKGAYYAVVSTGRPPESLTGSNDAGNDINNANYGVWGVNISYTNVTASPGKKMKNPWFTKTASVTKVYELCFKCHSDYGWGNNGPRFEIPDVPLSASGSGTFKNSTSSNIAREFNPNNLSHHAIFAPGRNQPITATGDTAGTASYYNTVWPACKSGTTGNPCNGTTVSINTSGVATFSLADIFSNKVTTAIAGWYIYAGSQAPAQGATTGWFQIAQITGNNTAIVKPAPTTAKNNVQFYLGAGLGNNFVPPYGPWSVISCADCHGSERQDPSGPHASSLQWIRKEIDRSISFDWFNGTKVVRVTYDATLNSAANTPYVCLNCHRSDVYGYEDCLGCTSGVTVAGGTPAGASYARVSHPVDDHGGDEEDGSQYSIFKIACMMCHGGSAGTLDTQDIDTLGSIHGSNVGKGSGGSYQGKRLLNGSAWRSVTRATTSSGVRCWTKSSSDAVNRCTEGHSGDSGRVANYTYESGAD